MILINIVLSIGYAFVCGTFIAGSTVRINFGQCHTFYMGGKGFLVVVIVMVVVIMVVLLVIRVLWALVMDVSVFGLVNHSLFLRFPP